VPGFQAHHRSKGARNQSDKVFEDLREVFPYADHNEWISDANPSTTFRNAHSGRVTNSHPSLDWSDVPSFLMNLARYNI
jgi:hypothetical protein